MKKNQFSASMLIFLSLFVLASQNLYLSEKEWSPLDFKERRDKLTSLISDGVVIISNDPGFYYFTGVDVPEAKLILIPKKIAEKTVEPESWITSLYLPPQDPSRGVWDDHQLFPGDDAINATGIENTVNIKSFYSDVSRLGNITGIVYLPYQANTSSPENISPDLQFVESIKKILPNVKIKNLTPFIDKLRWQKSLKEIEIMRKASEITIDAFKEAVRFTKPDAYEYEVEAIINYIFRKNGSQGAAFTIIGSGPNSCILHHSKNDRLMKSGDLLVIDIGTIYKTITTDLTRTIPVSGKFSPEQKKIYNIVLEAQEMAISIVKPGVTLADVHKAAMDVINAAGYGKYFIHGTSHTLNGGSPYKLSSLGLRLTGMFGKYKMNRYYAADNPLLPGSIFTIEPGIYIPEKNLGIRIEDDILVTESGHEILTKEAPKKIDEIENLMKEKTIHIK